MGACAVSAQARHVATRMRGGAAAGPPGAHPTGV